MKRHTNEIRIPGYMNCLIQFPTMQGRDTSCEKTRPITGQKSLFEFVLVHHRVILSL